MTWGIGPFQNDDAGDWVYELVEAEALDLLVDAFQSVLDHEDDYNEIPESQRAIAAAATLAALLDGESEKLPEEVQSWIESNAGLDAVEYIPMAAKALEVIQQNSELNDAWQETEDYAGWQESMDTLVSRLRTLQCNGNNSLGKGLV